MSLHWTLIAGFLYAEIVVVLLFLVPFISNKAWSKLFKSRFLKGLENQLIYYFYILVAILILFFLGNFKTLRNDVIFLNFHLLYSKMPSVKWTNMARTNLPTNMATVMLTPTIKCIWGCLEPKETFISPVSLCFSVCKYILWFFETDVWAFFVPKD